MQEIRQIKSQIQLHSYLLNTNEVLTKGYIFVIWEDFLHVYRCTHYTRQVNITTPGEVGCGVKLYILCIIIINWFS